MTASDKPNLAGLDRDGLRALFAGMGEKPFRADQVMKWIHRRGALDPRAMTDIGLGLRARLARETRIAFPEFADERVSADGSRKWTVRTAGGSKVETVFIPEAGRGTLCVSSQAGCALDCGFCATGRQGFGGDLEAAEIVGQLWRADRRLAEAGEGPVSNVVLMGMGEPLLNFENVMAAVSLMMDDRAYGLSKRRVTISTAGVAPAIRRMIGVTDASLAISLHAPDDELRGRLMPINRRWPIRELLDAARDYVDSLPDRRTPWIEYILIRGVNDGRRRARELAALLDGFPCKINLIPFNPFGGAGFERPGGEAVGAFRRILREAGFTATVRTTRAEDIGAACGQLVGEVAERARRAGRRREAAAGILASAGGA